jgi:hypothetical protein
LLTPASAITILGCGDLGRRMALPLAQRGATVRAWDRQLESGDGPLMHLGIEAAGVDPASTLADALHGARLVIAAVDAALSPELARSVAPLLAAGQVYLDLSGCADDIHQVNAALVERCGAHHVAGLLDESLLLAGKRAGSLAAALDTLGCPARAVASLPQRGGPDYHAATKGSALVHDAAAGRAPWRRGELP